MKDISMKRIIRYALAVFICLFFVANVLSNEARAESGNVSISNLSTYTYQVSSGGFAATIDFTKLIFDNQSYTGISEYYITDILNTSFGTAGNSTYFTCASGCTGGGFVSYVKTNYSNGGVIDWLFDPTDTFTSNHITLSYETNIFDSYNIPVPANFGMGATGFSFDSTHAIYVTDSTFTYPLRSTTVAFFVNHTAITTVETTVGYLVTYPFDRWSAHVTKDGRVNTKVAFENATNQQFLEGTFNNNSFNSSAKYTTGLWINVSSSNGYTTRQLINATNAGYPSPLTPGSGGSSSGQISYNFNNATIGNTYGINANITDANFSAFTTYYIYGYDANNNLIAGFPIDFSTQNYSTGKFWTFNKSGTYNATLKYCGILECVLGTRHDLDTASVYIPSASYAYSVTTDQANYQPGNTINIVATNPSPNPAYLTAFGETGIIDSIAWNTVISPGQSIGLSKVIPQDIPLGTYTLNLATTSGYYPIVAQETFNISSPANTSGVLSVLWQENVYLLGRVGAVTTTSGFNTSTLTITSPGGTTSSYSYPALSTNITMLTLDEVGLWKARIVDSGNASNYSQQNTTVTAGNPTDNETIAHCMSAATYICWDKRTYTQGQAYTISYKLPITALQTYFPYISIINPNKKEIYNQSINMSFDGSSNIYIGSISGSFTPQAATGVYFARLKASDLSNSLLKAESAAEVIASTIPSTVTTGASKSEDLLNSGYFASLLFMFIFAGIGMEIGGGMGTVLGFGGGFIFSAIYGLVPLWSVYLFAILAITAFAVMVARKTTGEGAD